jgi:hypothetical protein
MANRKVHNYLARMFVNMPMNEIDEINRKIDEPYKWLGRYHRVLNHDKRPEKIDSVMITHGDVQKEIVRQIHIWLDENKDVGDLLEAYLLMKKRRR